VARSPLTRWQHAVNDADVSWRAKVVGQSMSLQMDTVDLTTKVGVQWLADHTHTSESTVIRGRGELEDAGLLIVESSPGGRGKTSLCRGVIPSETVHEVHGSRTETPADRQGLRPQTPSHRRQTPSHGPRNPVPQTPDLVVDLSSLRDGLGARSRLADGEHPLAREKVRCDGCGVTFATGSPIVCEFGRPPEGCARRAAIAAARSSR
jgi:hypothetical protein